MNYIKVLDKYGKVNNWTIEYDAGDYYEVFYKNSITVLKKTNAITLKVIFFQVR